MNVYDFDNTIYDGESVVDFYLFCAKRKPKLLKYLPMTFFMLIKYKLGQIEIKELEKKGAKYTKKMLLDFDNDIEEIVKNFWDKNEHKIKSFYLKQKQSDDIIISASCGFILDEIFRRIGITRYMCSEIDLKSGEILSLCYHSNKPEIFKKNYPGAEIDEFYTDSSADIPMAKLAKRAYLVKGNKIKPIVFDKGDKS